MGINQHKTKIKTQMNTEHTGREAEPRKLSLLIKSLLFITHYSQANRNTHGGKLKLCFEKCLHFLSPFLPSKIIFDDLLVSRLNLY